MTCYITTICFRQNKVYRVHLHLYAWSISPATILWSTSMTGWSGTTEAYNRTLQPMQHNLKACATEKRVG